MTALTLTLPLHASAITRAKFEALYDHTGDGDIVPALVIAPLTEFEAVAIADWLAPPDAADTIGTPCLPSETPVVDAAEELAEVLLHRFPDAHTRLTVASMLLASVALDAGIDDPTPVSDQLTNTMHILRTMRDDPDLLEDLDPPQPEFAA